MTKKVANVASAASAFARLLDVELPTNVRVADGVEFIRDPQGAVHILKSGNVFRVPDYFTDAAHSFVSSLNGDACSDTDDNSVAAMAFKKILNALGCLEHPEARLPVKLSVELASTNQFRRVRQVLAESLPRFAKDANMNINILQQSSAPPHVLIYFARWSDADYEVISEALADRYPRIMLASATDQEIRIGPTVLSGLTGCLLCYQRRAFGSLGFPSGAVLPTSSWSRKTQLSDWGAHQLTTHLVAELHRTYVEGEPSTVGAICIENVRVGRIDRFPVMVHPACSCRIMR